MDYLDPPSLSLGKSSRRPPMSTKNRWMPVFTDRPSLVCLWVGIHRKTSLWPRPFFFYRAQHILLGWCGRWKVSGCTVAVLWGAISRICSNQHTICLRNWHLSFSPGVSLNSKWCNLAIVLTGLQVGRILVFSYQRDQLTIGSITCQFQSMLTHAYAVIAFGRW